MVAHTLVLRYLLEVLPLVVAMYPRTQMDGSREVGALKVDKQTVQKEESSFITNFSLHFNNLSFFSKRTQLNINPSVNLWLPELFLDIYFH